LSYENLDNEALWKEVGSMLETLSAREGLIYKVMVPRHSAHEMCEDIYQQFMSQKKDFCPKCHAPLD